MDPDNLTDEQIGNLLATPKRIRNPKARDVPKAKHIEKNFEVESEDRANQFVLITRQSTVIAGNFSCGLIWQVRPGHRVILTRYNGFDHAHANPLERQTFEFQCHIHRATTRYIHAGRKAEMFAEVTQRYATLSDALKCLTDDCGISGLPRSPDTDEPQTRLFDGNDDR